MRDTTNRRGFLSTVGAAGVAVGVGSVGALGVRQGEDPQTTYRLGGVTAGWRGRSPASLSGTVNPTLDLEDGTLYEITWVNVDGAPHNVAILAGNGDVLEQTEIVSEQGASQSLQFTASGEMATYICQVHPNSMVGDVVVGGGGAQQTTVAPDQTATVNETTATDRTTAPGRTTAGNRTTMTTTVPNPTEAEVEETPHPLADQYGENPVRFISPLESPQGVRTEATGTTWFTLHPPNGAVAKLMYSLYVENAENVQSAHVHLDNRPGDPVVANLYQPSNPVDAISGTLVDTNMTAEDLVGPFEGEPLLRLTEAIRNDNAYVDVHSVEYPEGLLAGAIRTVSTAGPTGETTVGDETTTTAADGTTIADDETTVADGTTMADGTTTTANETTTTAADGTGENRVDSGDVVQRVRAPGFGVLSALGGLAGAAGYLLSRGDDD